MFIKPYTVSRNALCPCRSGKKYKHCCADTINTNLKDKYSKFYQAGQYTQALSAYRAFLTQYIIWYNQHTVPFVDDKPLEADEILRLDIDALIETLHGIACCLNKLDKPDEIDPFLRRCTDIVQDDRYEFCILGERALWFLIQGDNHKSKQILIPAKGLESSRMVTTYYGRLYLNLFLESLWVEIPLGESLQILHALSTNVDDPLRELYQLARKALIYFVYLDIESATSTIDEAIVKLQKLQKTEDKDESLLMVGASVYQVKGMICKDNSAMVKACDLYKDLLTFLNDNEYVSAINHCLGQLYYDLREYQIANNHLQIAYDSTTSPHEGLVIDLAKSFIMLNDIKQAQEFLQTLDINNMEDLYKIDYYSLISQIAIKKNNRELAEQIQPQLAGLNATVPIFREMISDNRIALMEMVASGKDSTTIPKVLREAISKYLLLQPNFFGLGINLNELIKPKKHTRKG